MDADARLIRWGGYAAFGAVAMNVMPLALFGVIAGDLPERDDTPALLAFAADNATLGAAVTWLFVAGFALFIPAVLGFHAALKATKLPLLFGTALTIIGFVLLAIGVTLSFQGFLSLGSSYAEAGAASRPAIEAAAAAWAAAGYVGVVGSSGIAIGAVVLALASLDTRMVPTWLGWAGVAGAIAQGVGDPLSQVPDVFVVGKTLQGVGVLGLWLWFVGMGMKMVRGKVPTAGGGGRA